MQPEKSLLIVDDDSKLRQLLVDYLGQSGFSVIGCANGRDMRQQLDHQTFQAVVLDLMLPAENGLDLLRWIQANSPTPTLILSAKGNEDDRILGLELGADDYLPKPFNPRELVARLNNLIKRHTKETNPINTLSQSYQFSQWCFYPTKQLIETGQIQLSLSSTETELLSLFCRHPNTPLDRNFLMRSLKGYEHQATDRTIDVRVKRLRKKLNALPELAERIQTVWGKGYLFSVTETASNG